MKWRIDSHYDKVKVEFHKVLGYLKLTPEQARKLADDLERAADQAETWRDSDGKE